MTMKSSLHRMFVAPFAVSSKAFGPRSQRAWTRRAQMMVRNTWLLVFGACLLVAGLGAVAFYVSSRPTFLTFAVPSTNADDLRLVQAITQQFSRERAGIRLRPTTVENPAQSAAAIEAGTSDLAIVRADLPVPKQGLVVAVLRHNVVVMIVPAAGSEARAKPNKGARAKPKKIDKIEDLSGLRIGVIGRGSTPNNTEVVKVVLRQYEIAPEKVAIVPIDSENVRTALRKAPVDVIIVVGPVTSQYITEAIAAASTATVQPSFLSIGASEAIANRLPFYVSTELKEGVFGGKRPLPNDSVETIAFNHYIVARRELSESQVADFARLLFGARQGLRREVPAIAKIEKPDTDNSAAVQAHPGAIAFFENDQKTFFDRYSDLLFLVVIAMGFVGSAITWLATYVRADERVRRMRVIDNLLDVVRRARQAQTLEDVEKLRLSVDDMLKRTLQNAEQRKLDEPALITFSLAIAQAQLAINDRQATLRSAPSQTEIVSAGLANPAALRSEPVSSAITSLRRTNIVQGD